ncbi:hypothetical protein PGQ11_007595 [Apiospora arundinis]|uniref:F-box domain-containing protein n=1 Tax=Apiospora arundinis TaxID=335852 RepID=A0ABR2IW43_9PEZI
MAFPTFNLDSLPVEIQCCIFRHLDPITLIAFSQTSTHYRRVISPSRRNYAERLLALELLEEHGGVTSIFRPRHNVISPDWRDSTCDSMRWACTACLRLLPHTAFGNHFLLGLGYRKPEPGSPAAAEQTVSSWEPSRDARYWQALKRYKQRADVVFEQKRLRRQYSGASTRDYRRYATARDAEYSETALARLIDLAQPAGFQPCHLELERAREEMGQFALEYERRNAGYKRHLRRCLECNWRRGELRPHATQYDGILGGTLKVPVAHSRQLYFGCGLDRHFPGFTAPLNNEPPTHSARVFVIYREDPYDLPFTLHMVRCPGCTRWQELRAFRVGTWYARWTIGYGTARGEFENWDQRPLGAEFYDSLICNHCLAGKGDDESMKRLRDELQGFWLHCAYAKLLQLVGEFEGGFRQLYYATWEMPKGHPVKRLIRKEILRDIIGPGVRERSAGNSYDWDDIESSGADLALYRLRYRHWKDAWARCKDDVGMEKFKARLEESFRERDYNIAEEHFIWLKKCRQEVLENPQVLIDWALARDGSALT